MPITPWPQIVLLGWPVASARSMAHALHGTWQKEWQTGQTVSSSDEPQAAFGSFQCIAPLPAQTWPRTAHVYLLGLDWRAPQDTAANAAHQQWRAQLQARGQGFVVLYGKPARQWAQLVTSLKALPAPQPWDWLPQEQPKSSAAPLRGRNCELCDDPQCEQRLFSALL